MRLTDMAKQRQRKNEMKTNKKHWSQCVWWERTQKSNEKRIEKQASMQENSEKKQMKNPSKEKSQACTELAQTNRQRHDRHKGT